MTRRGSSPRMTPLKCSIRLRGCQVGSWSRWSSRSRSRTASSTSLSQRRLGDGPNAGQGSATDAIGTGCRLSSNTSRWSRPGGMGPVNRLWPNRSSWSHSGCPNSAGSGPVNRLWLTFSFNNCLSCPSSAGSRPVNRLWLTSRSLRCQNVPSSAGMDPSSPLRFKFSSCKFLSCPSSPGIEPVSWLPLKSRRSTCASCPRTEGIGPVSWLPLRSRRSTCASCPRAEGIGPVSWLPLRSRCSTWTSRPSAGGTAPVNSLPAKSSTLSRVSWPTSGGIGPRNPFSRRTTWVNSDSRPSAGGSDPTSRNLGSVHHPINCKPVTRRGSLPRLTPSKFSIRLSGCQVRSRSRCSPRSRSRTASSTSLSQRRLRDGPVSGHGTASTVKGTRLAVTAGWTSARTGGSSSDVDVVVEAGDMVEAGVVPTGKAVSTTHPDSTNRHRSTGRWYIDRHFMVRFPGMGRACGRCGTPAGILTEGPGGWTHARASTPAGPGSVRVGADTTATGSGLQTVSPIPPWGWNGSSGQSGFRHLANGPLWNTGTGAAQLAPSLGHMRSKMPPWHQRSMLVPGTVCGTVVHDDWLRARRFRRPGLQPVVRCPGNGRLRAHLDRYLQRVYVRGRAAPTPDRAGIRLSRRHAGHLAAGSVWLQPAGKSGHHHSGRVAHLLPVRSLGQV